ncbi:hypothetical protein BZG36_01932 [Bifiguratus adelaidae]|uniref:Uncharacterized protein n=1 Tax=Bifiguratus adelaidae TaxID=1938954 RepID=A0A261Y3W0_9FUNG|nr:hypothetical protein BZG36_01932 [Bifiguratus adelaidae]
MSVDGVDGPFYPFPPFYSSGNYTFQSPFFLTPVCCAAVLVLVALPHYLWVTRNKIAEPDLVAVDRQTGSSRLASEEETQAILDSGAERTPLAYTSIRHPESTYSIFRNSPPIDQAIHLLSFAIILTHITGMIITILHAVRQSEWTANASVLFFYDTVSVLNWCLAFVLLVGEVQVLGSFQWCQYAAWWSFAVGESMIAWMWGEAFRHPRDGTVFSNYDYAYFYVFLVRYLAINILLLCTLVSFYYATPKQALMPRAQRQDLEQGTATRGEMYGTFSTPAPAAPSPVPPNAPILSGAQHKPDIPEAPSMDTIEPVASVPITTAPVTQADERAESSLTVDDLEVKQPTANEPESNPEPCDIQKPEPYENKEPTSAIEANLPPQADQNDDPQQQDGDVQQEDGDSPDSGNASPAKKKKKKNRRKKSKTTF